MSRFNSLSGAIRIALLASAASMAATAALAQDDQTDSAAADEEEVLDEMVVTGTRIQSQTVTSASPVLEIQKEEFKFAGATKVEELVNQYPQLAPAFDSVTNNGATGYATIDLRSLGPQRTLTLVNGQRLAPGPAGELRDISIIPAALVSRVDLLTGGASAVYGSDAVAGVVNFILDTEFEGVSLSAGYSAYQHDNDNDYMQGLQTARGFTFEEGDSGFDGVSRNVDFAIGSTFGDGAGHAMAWLTWRENKALFQGQRDYASCALNGPGTACGGSNTNAAGNFYFYQPTVGLGGPARIGANGRFVAGYGAPYNFAPINYFQRPDERYTFGNSLKYEVNEHFRPYLETMFINRSDSIQIAESGTFFIPLAFQCNDPILRTACADLGLDPTAPLTVYVAKRNIEGGPRRTSTEDTSYRVVLGSEGSINESWNYNASFLYARTNNDTQGENDFLFSRIEQAIRGCPAGSFAGCLPYTIFNQGGVTVAAANALAGRSFNKTQTEMTILNAYASGDLGFGFSSAGGENLSLVLGIESRREEYRTASDNDSAAGNFAGAGATAPPVIGQTKVQELFMESQIPIFASDDGFLKKFGAEIGYRYSDYERSGSTNTYKIAFAGEFDYFRVRGGFNRAIRAPGINNLFAPQRVALFVGSDPCAGATPVFTQAQCANTGVSAAQYGRIPQNAAGQNNQFIGGNPNLQPEEADTYTLGFVVTPIDALEIAVDFYDIKIEDTIAAIGANTILRLCATSGNPFLCSRIQRNPTSGDLFRNNTQFVRNLTDNFGELSTRGIDLTVNYAFEALGGTFTASLLANYTLDYDQNPLPGVDTSTAAGFQSAEFDCAGFVNTSCQLQDFRAISSLRYTYDKYTASMRWRHYGALDYVNIDGTPGVASQDAIIAPLGGIGSYNYIDLSGTASFTENLELTLGINNIFDKEPPITGATLAPINANSPGGYDQLGRYIFSSINLKF